MYRRNAHLLDYLKTKTPTDDGFTERLEQRVLKIEKDTEWRDDYMTLEMKMDEKYEQGREQGLKEVRTSVKSRRK